MVVIVAKLLDPMVSLIQTVLGLSVTHLCKEFVVAKFSLQIHF